MSRFEIKTPQAWAGAPVVVTSYDWKGMGNAIVELEARMDQFRLMLVGAATDPRITGLVADVSRIEQKIEALQAAARAYAPPKTERRAEGEYLVRWQADAVRAVGRWRADGVLDRSPKWWVEVNEDLGFGGKRCWHIAPAPPHWIGPRVDMREG